MTEPGVTESTQDHQSESGPDLDRLTIPELNDRLAAGTLTAAELTESYRDRIRRLDPLLNCIIAVDPTAPAQAKASDRRRLAGRSRGPLDGIPVLIKDNLDAVGLPGSAGSRALLASAPTRDSAVVAALRAAGAVILGAANLSEWANFRSTRSTSGWSAVGGQTSNPHVLDRNPSGSSSGSAAAVAASLAQFAIGTETDGSIVSPAAACGVVGLKPSLGLISRAGIVPITPQQDTAGPIARHVVDLALAMRVLCGVDPADPVTTAAPELDWDLTGREHTLAGTALGLWWPEGTPAATRQVVERDVLPVLAAAGARVVEVTLPYLAEISALEWTAMTAEFRPALERYLRGRPGAPRTLAKLVEFNQHDPVELGRFGQEIFEKALDAPPITDAGYRRDRATLTDLARRCLDETMAAHRLEAIITPSNAPAWPIDYPIGDTDHLGSSSPAAVSGYPSVTVPAGLAGALPIGMSFIGSRFGDARLLALAAAFETLTAARRAPEFLPTIPMVPTIPA